MNKFFLIFKTQFLSAINQGRAGSKKSAAKKLTSTAGYIFLMIFFLLFAAFYEWAFAMAFAINGMLDTLISIVVFASSLVTLISSVTAAKSIIFGSKDHDMIFPFL